MNHVMETVLLASGFLLCAIFYGNRLAKKVEDLEAQGRKILKKWKI